MITETIISAVTTQAIKSLVEKIIAPKFENFIKYAKTDYKDYIDRNNPYFEKYYNRTYEKYSIINTLVFHNYQRKLKDIYVTQTLVKGNLFEGNEESTEIDKFPRKLIKKYQKILITDTAGMGKSTIMKRMFIDLIDNGLEDVGIPIYIELNRLNKSRTILTEIHEELNSLSKEFDKDLLLRFIQTCGFIFFLDGYDEISIADKDEVTQDIKDFITRASTGNYFIMTSRPEGSLSSFGDFQSFTIQPLKKDEAFELLRKYDVSKEKKLSGKLVELLESGQYRSIEEFLKNPLLVSLLFTAYDFNRSIPFEKHRFYGVVFEAYFEKHDNTKAMKKREKYSNLNYDGFDRILRYVGYDCLIRTGVKFNKDTILNTIRKAKEFCGVSNFSENAFLEDLVSTVPLFCKEGTDYKWVHKSLLEYFAARFIYCDAKENQDRILTAIYKSEHLDKYINMLDLYYDIDLKGFSKNFTLPFCEKYIENYDALFNDLTINKELISARISSLFFAKSVLLVSSEIEPAKRQINRFYADTNSDYDLHKTYRIQNADNEMVYLAHEHVSKEHLLACLYDRKKSFIIDSGLLNIFEYQNLRKNGFPKEISEFEHDKVYFIDINTGNQSKRLYQTIDIALLWIFKYRINFEACKKEAERIRKKIEQSNNVTVLLDGI